MQAFRTTLSLTRRLVRDFNVLGQGRDNRAVPKLIDVRVYLFGVHNDDWLSASNILGKMGITNPNQFDLALLPKQRIVISSMARHLN
jgi:hypothetical protein